MILEPKTSHFEFFFKKSNYIVNLVVSLLFSSDTDKVSKWGKKRAVLLVHRQSAVNLQIHRFIRPPWYSKLQIDFKLPKKSLWGWPNGDHSQGCWTASKSNPLSWTSVTSILSIFSQLLKTKIGILVIKITARKCQLEQEGWMRPCQKGQSH